MHGARWFNALVVGTLVVGAMVAPSAGAVGPDQACFYAAIDYGGASVCAPVGGAVDVTGLGGVSSVKLIDVLADGVLPSVQLYDQTDYGGAAFVVSANDPDLRNDQWNDRAVSVKVVGAPSVCLFEKVNFDNSGLSTCLQLGQTVDLSHNVRSVRLSTFERFDASPPDARRDIGGLVVTLYTGIGATGASLTVTATMGDLGVRAWRDKAKSARVTRLSCDWRQLKMTWPMRGNATKQPWYDSPYYGQVGNYLPLDSLGGGNYSDFMGNVQGYHNGVDLSTFTYRELNDDGVEVRAAAGGIVIGLRDGLYDQDGGSGYPDEWSRNDVWPYAVPGMTDWNGEPVSDGSGNVVYLQHPNGFITQYAHLKIGVSGHVRLGQWVPGGALLGVVGSSGASSGPHLHFGVYAGKECQAMNPTWFGFAAGERTAQPSGRISRVAAVTSNTGAMVESFYREPDGKTAGGETMWTGPIVPYKAMDSVKGETARRRFAQFSINAVPIWYFNPADNIGTVPVGQPVRWLAHVWGNTDDVTVKITNPSGAVISNVPISYPWGLSSFVPSVPGTYTFTGIVHDQVTGALTSQFSVTITAIAAPVKSTFAAASVATERLRDGVRVGKTSGTTTTIGETADLDVKQGALVRFPIINGTKTKYVIAQMRMPANGITGYTPFGQGNGPNLPNGFGWAGRLYVDLVDGSGNVLMPRVGQFNNVPMFDNAWSPNPAPDPEAKNRAEAVIKTSAIPLLAKANVFLRISFEHPNNLSDDVDNIKFTAFKLLTSSTA